MIPIVSPPIDAYCLAHTTPADSLLDELAAYTRANCKLPQMLTGPVEGTLLRMLVQVSSATRVLEIGTFTGYSALSMAAGLPDDGELFTCDIDPETNAIARSFWARSPHGGKIKPLLGTALETVATLPADAVFDFVFIDADKENYLNLHARFHPFSSTCKISTMDSDDTNKGSTACRSHGKSSSHKRH